jgi:hypothetical protein
MLMTYASWEDPCRQWKRYSGVQINWDKVSVCVLWLFSGHRELRVCLLEMVGAQECDLEQIKPVLAGSVHLQLSLSV